mmetsp:Transcript_11899/g.27749  ORF Transcript_11899/g.27749 Transcript_11899/m.27749 type:complete len:234 (+) Transcript_11899:951-1652(+)
MSIQGRSVSFGFAAMNASGDFCTHSFGITFAATNLSVAISRIKHTHPWFRAALWTLRTSSYWSGSHAWTMSGRYSVIGSSTQDESSLSAFVTSVKAVEASESSDNCFKKPDLANSLFISLLSVTYVTTSAASLQQCSPTTVSENLDRTCTGCLKPRMAPPSPAPRQTLEDPLSSAIRGNRAWRPNGLSYQKFLARTPSTCAICSFIVPTTSDNRSDFGLSAVVCCPFPNDGCQ